MQETFAKLFHHRETGFGDFLQNLELLRHENSLTNSWDHHSWPMTKLSLAAFYHRRGHAIQAVDLDLEDWLRLCE